MKNTIKNELRHHIINMINDGVLTMDNKEDWHFHAFNEDYYIIGYYYAEKWLNHHNLSPFEAIAICQEYEKNNFGEICKVYDNAEVTVNMLAYIYGEQIIYEMEKEIEELINQFENL